MKKTKVFNPKACAHETQVMHSIVDEDGETVNYYWLTWKDLQALNEVANTPEYPLKLLFKMLSRANEGLTYEDVEALTPHKIGMLVNLLLKAQELETKVAPKKEEPAGNVKQ